MLSLYQTLEISPGASREDITRAYRKLAMKWHPDRNGNSKYAEDKFKEIKLAYETLIDPSYKYEPQKPASKPVAPPAFHVSDVYPDVTIRISLNEVDTGAMIKGSQTRICPSCSGSGKLYGNSYSIGGNVWGKKEVYASDEDKKQNRCPSCEGKGEEKAFECWFDVPPGVWDGVTIKLNCLTKDKTQIFKGATKNVRINVEQHPFVRKGNDLYMSTSVDSTTLKNGGEIDVFILNNRKMLVKLPSGCKDGSTLRLSGVGLPDLQTRERGNIYLTLRNP